MYIYSLVDEECIPYVAQDTKCTIPFRNPTLLASGCNPPESPSKRKNRYTVSPPVKIGSESDIMYEISTSGPLQGMYYI